MPTDVTQLVVELLATETPGTSVDSLVVELLLTDVTDPAPPAEPCRCPPEAVRYVWLLDVTAPGVELRYATERVTVALGAGSVEYRAGLADLTAAQGDTVDVTVTDPALDWPGISVALYYAPAVLRRWRVGTRRETADTYCVGTVGALEHGPRTQPVAWTIAPDTVTSPACPDPRSVVSPITSPDPAPDPPVTLTIPVGQSGLGYPIVFGWPGYAPITPEPGRPTRDDPWPVVPIPVWQLPTTLGGSIHGGPVGVDLLTDTYAQAVISEDPSTTNPSQVFVWDSDREVGVDQTNTSVTSDKLGRSIVVTHFDDLTVYPSRFETIGGIFAGYTPAGDPSPMRDAYSVVTYLLRRFGGSSVDWSSMPETQDVLGQYMVDTYLNTPPGPDGVWSWLANVLVPSLPIAIRTGTRGRYVQVLRYTTDPRRTVRELDPSRSAVVRMGPVTVSSVPLNQFRAVYQDSGDGFVDSVNLGLADPAALVFGHGLCAASQARYGRRDAPEVQLSWTWDRATAHAALVWRAERDALPARRVLYAVPETLGLREGHQVRVVDYDVGLDDLAIVEGPPLVGGPSGTVVTLRIPGR